MRTKEPPEAMGRGALACLAAFAFCFVAFLLVMGDKPIPGTWVPAARAETGGMAAHTVATLALGSFAGNPAVQATGAAAITAGTAEHYSWTTAPQSIIIANASTSGTRLLGRLNTTTWADHTIGFEFEVGPGQRMTLPADAFRTYYGAHPQMMLVTDIMLAVPAGGGNPVLGSQDGFNVVGYYVQP